MPKSSADNGLLKATPAPQTQPLTNKASKDGKVKSKNFNLFTEQIAQAEKNVMSSQGSVSDIEDDDDAVSEKLVK